MSIVCPLDIERIDSRLSLAECFTNGRNIIYKVIPNKKFYVLKIADRESWYRVRDMELEKKVLKIAKNVSGITHLVKEYDANELHGGAVLKEYFEGKVHEDYMSKDAKNGLIETVRELHALGVSGIDVKSENVIVSPDGNYAKIVDLGMATLLENEPQCPSFENGKNADFRRFKLFFG